MSEPHTTSSEIDLRFVCCAEEIHYQRQLAALLPTWRGDNFAPAVPDAAFPWLDKSKIQL